jgi:hypothetical protein
MKRLHAKVNRGDERMIAVAQHHAANTEHRAANTVQPTPCSQHRAANTVQPTPCSQHRAANNGEAESGGRIQSVLPIPIVDDYRLVKAVCGFLNLAIIAPA